MTTYPLPMIHAPQRWSLDIGAPLAEPVSVADVKAHLAVDHDDDDEIMASMLVAARNHVEDYTRRALVTQTRILRLDGFPVGDAQVIELPGGKIQSITSIQYQDADDATQTLSAAVYDTDFATNGGTGRISLANGQSWPDTRSRGLPVVITYVAGFPSDGASPPNYAANVPAAIKVAIKMIAGGLYLVREAQASREIFENRAVQALLSPWVIHRFT